MKRTVLSYPAPYWPPHVGDRVVYKTGAHCIVRQVMPGNAGLYVLASDSPDTEFEAHSSDWRHYVEEIHGEWTGGTLPEPRTYKARINVEIFADSELHGWREVE